MSSRKINMYRISCEKRSQRLQETLAASPTKRWWNFLTSTKSSTSLSAWILRWLSATANALKQLNWKVSKATKSWLTRVWGFSFRSCPFIMIQVNFYLNFRKISNNLLISRILPRSRNIHTREIRCSSRGRQGLQRSRYFDPLRRWSKNMLGYAICSATIESLRVWSYQKLQNCCRLENGSITKAGNWSRRTFDEC